MLRLIIIRGLPGSGKSTLAKQLDYQKEFRHFEADQFFMDSGEYNFNPNLLGEAHAWCLGQTEECLRRGENVIVSNTFTTIRELKPYFEVARKMNIVPNVLTCHNIFKSVHNVPEETMEKMRKRFVCDISELFG